MLAEGRSGTEAKRKLKLTRRELDVLREDAATRKLELRLGQLIAPQDPGPRNPTHAPYVTSRSAWPRRRLRPDLRHCPAVTVAGLPSPLSAARHDPTAADRRCRTSSGSRRRARSAWTPCERRCTCLPIIPTPAEPLASILRLIADGRSRAEAAQRARNLTEGVQCGTRPAPPPRRSSRSCSKHSALSAVARPIGGGPGAGPRAEMVSAGALGTGAQQMVPVRFPEAQHQRLKTGARPRLLDGRGGARPCGALPRRARTPRRLSAPPAN